VAWWRFEWHQMMNLDTVMLGAWLGGEHSSVVDYINTNKALHQKQKRDLLQEAKNITVFNIK